MFNKISNDPYIIDLYEKIKEREDLNNEWAYHSFSHISNVVNIVETTLVNLKYSQEIIESAKIAAFLHDIGCMEGKNDHALRSYQMAKDYFENNNFNIFNLNQILEAIKIHSDGFDTDNVIALALIFADKLDIKYDRLSKAGYEIEGLRELQYIKDIIINIENDELIVKFIVDDKINKTALENYYFIPKVFKAIKSFARKIALKDVVLLNNENWEYR